MCRVLVSERLQPLLLRLTLLAVASVLAIALLLIAARHCAGGVAGQLLDRPPLAVDMRGKARRVACPLGAINVGHVAAVDTGEDSILRPRLLPADHTAGARLHVTRPRFGLDGRGVTQPGVEFRLSPQIRTCADLGT